MTTEWKLVPVEPTRDMLNVVNGCPEDVPEFREWVDEDNTLTYHAMLAAAPQPPPQWPAPRPMSEAPKDKPVLAWWAEKQWAVSSWLETRSRWACLGHDTTTSPQPTHWLPMPPEPTTETTK